MHDVQFADQGYLEVDGPYEWDNDYPNPVRISPSLLSLPLTSSAQCAVLSSARARATLPCRLVLTVMTCSRVTAQVTYTAPDKVLTDPGIVTIQFDNVLYSVRSSSRAVCSVCLSATMGGHETR